MEVTNRLHMLAILLTFLLAWGLIPQVVDAQEFTVRTDKSSYRFAELIVIEGDVGNLECQNDAAFIRVMAPTGNLVDLIQSFVNSNGEFQEKIAFHESGNIVYYEGNYKITASCGPASVDTEFYFFGHEMEAPSPTVEDVIFPKSIFLGEKATITVIASNQGAPADWQTLQLSFPIGIVSKDIKIGKCIPECKIYPVGTRVGGAYGETQSIATRYPFIENLLKPSNGEKTIDMEITVEPQAVGQIQFYVKSISKSGTQFYYFPDSGTRDQQSEFASVHTIDVLASEGDASSQPDKTGKVRILANDGRILGHYRTVEEAIIAASPGDTISLAKGSYSGFAIDKSISVVGEDSVVVEGIILVQANDVTIKHLTAIVQADATSMGFFVKNLVVDDIIGRVIILGGDESEIRNSVLRAAPKSSPSGEGTAVYYAGAAIYVQGSNNQIFQNTIEGSDNACANNGLYVYVGNDNLISKNLFRCLSTAIQIGERLGDRTVQADRATIKENTIENTSLGIEIWGDSNSIRDNHVAASDTSILLADTASNSRISHNNFMVNGVDNGRNNVWSIDSGGQKLGNYWAPWSARTLDRDEDGILDHQYQLGGSAIAYDKYPASSSYDIVIVPEFGLFSVIPLASAIAASMIVYRMRSKNKFPCL